MDGGKASSFQCAVEMLQGIEIPPQRHKDAPPLVRPCDTLHGLGAHGGLQRETEAGLCFGIQRRVKPEFERIDKRALGVFAPGEKDLAVVRPPEIVVESYGIG